MKIQRNGIEIELTSDEIVKAWEEHERSIFRTEIEYVINDNGYKFDNYKEQGSDYASADDFRSDFIEMCVESCLEKMTDSEFSAWTDKISDVVYSNADDFDLEEEF